MAADEQVEITRLMEDIRSTEDYNKRYEEQLKQMSHAGNQNETTLKALMQMHETLVSELRKVFPSSLCLCMNYLINIRWRKKRNTLPNS